MSEELKQEIIITVTEADFKRHNPDIDIDEMRLHNFAEQLMRAVQNRLDSLNQRYHTCISTEPPQAKASLWISVEDMPAGMTASPYPPSDKEWATKYFVLKHEALPEDVEMMTATEIWLDEGSEVALYMPIPELPSQ